MYSNQYPLIFTLFTHIVVNGMGFNAFNVCVFDTFAKSHTLNLYIWAFADKLYLETQLKIIERLTLWIGIREKTI